MSFLSTPITLQSIFGARREIGAITVDAIIDENTVDALTITKQPVQLGASITDHSFLEPTVLTMRILQQVSNPITQLLSTFADAGSSGLAQLYQEFIKLQATRSPFTVTTPKRVYEDMLIATLRLNTDKLTENILSLSISFQQVFIVSISTAEVPRELQRNAGITGATQAAGKKSSGLFNLNQAKKAVFGQ